MPNNKPDKACEAQLVDAHDGAAGEEKQAAVVNFARQVLDVYLPHRDASTYARHKPLRTLLKAYRTYYRLDPPDRRHQMAANLRQIFQSPPNDVSVFTRDLEEKSFAVVDGFLSLVDVLYAGIRSLVSRNENELVYAYDLAVDLVSPSVRVAKQKEQARTLAVSVRALQAEANPTDEQKAKLQDDQRKLYGVLRDLEKAGEKDFVAQIRAELSKGGK